MVKTRSGKAYGNKPDIPLMLLHDLVPKIIGKMHNLELLRMRQTCSSINSLVEKRTEILSKRIMRVDSEMETMQRLIDVTIDVNEGKIEISLYVNGTERKIGGDMKEQLGAFTINKITVTNYGSYAPAKYAEAVQWIRQMRLSCTEFFLEMLPFQFAFDILEAVENLAEANLNFRKRLTTQTLHLLSSSRHVSVIQLDARTANLHRVPVEVVKKFRELTIVCYRAQALRNMIENIQSTNDSGNLKWIQYSTVYHYDSRKFKIPFPRLYKGDEPRAIYWKELLHKQMVVIHSSSEPGNFEFFFIEKGSDVLTDFIMENVLFMDDFKEDVREDFREIFTRASFEEKGELLKEAEDKKVYEPWRGMCARKAAPSHMARPYSSDTETDGAPSGSSSDSD